MTTPENSTAAPPIDAATAAGAPPPEGSPPAPAPAPQPPTWGELVAGLPDELRGDASRFGSLADFAKGKADLRRQLSGAREGYVKAPHEGMNEADRKAWNEVAGIPDAPADYGITVPEHADEGVKDRVSRFLQDMHAAGAPRSMVEKAMAFQASEEQAVHKAGVDAILAEREKAELGLRREWGRDFTRNTELATRALEHFGDDAARDALIMSGMGDHPAIIKLFSKVGALLAEDIPAIQSGPARSGPDLGAITSEFADRQAKGTHTDPEFLSRYNSAFQRAYGGR